MKKKFLNLLLVLTLLVSLGGVFASPTLAAPADCYWVGDGGNWSDAAVHWAVASGGAPNIANLPDATSNVHFDGNSFTIGGQTVTLDVEASCLDMDWTGATDTPTITGGTTQRINGDLTLIAAMSWTCFGAIVTGTGTYITVGIPLTNVYIQVGGVLTLGDALVATRIALAGTFISANFTVTLSDRFDTPFGGVLTITLGTSTVNTAAWDMSGSNPTITPNTATINVTGTGAFAGGDIATYHDVNLIGTAHTISGDNTFNSLDLDSAIAQTITFTDGSNQTVTDASLSGSAGFLHTLQGSGVAGWTITKAGGGYILCDYLDLSYSTGAPIETWSYGTHSTIGADVIDWGIPYFYINIDGVEEDGVWAPGVSVPDNANDWLLQYNYTTDFMPYMAQYEHTVGGTLIVDYAPAAIVVNTDYDGTADAGSDDDTIIDAELTQAEDYWIGALVTITSAGDAAPEGETSICTAFAAATDEVTVTPAFTVAVAATDEYTIEFGTLADLEGAAQDGRITWGVNPTGIAVSMTGLVSDYSVGVTSELETSEILPAEHVTPVSLADLAIIANIENIPILYPVAVTFSDLSGFSVVWLFRAFFLLLSIGTFVLTYSKMKSLLLSGVFSCAILGIALAITVFPFYAIGFVIIILAGCVVLEART